MEDEEGKGQLLESCRAVGQVLQQLPRAECEVDEIHDPGSSRNRERERERERERKRGGGGVARSESELSLRVGNNRS